MMLEHWKTIYETHSPINGQIKVIESGKVRKLIASGFTQSKSLNEKGLAEGYWDAFREIENWNLKIENCLILGLGAGTIVQIWRSIHPKLKIKAVEIDKVIVDLAKKYFGLPADISVIIGDGCSLIINQDSRLSREQYDLMVIDTFCAGQFDPQCESDNFLNNLAGLLSPKGRVFFNRIFSPNEEKQIKELITSLEKFFSQIELIYPKRKSFSYNLIITGQKR